MPSPVPRVRFLTGLAALSVACGGDTTTPSATSPAAVGFGQAAWSAQEVCESRFLELPSSDAFRKHLRTITADPHPTGSEAQIRVGDYIARSMTESGWDVERHEYDVYLPQLTDDVEAHIVTPEPMQLTNREPVLEEDRFSSHPDLLNGWNAFSGSGDVIGQVVYANFGRREDYRALDSLGVSLEGRVVVARYGGNFRGYKVKFAEERGAAGVIMFNDPGGAPEGAPYPDGPMMSPWTIQRGSVLTLPWTGDPLTPFVAALPLEEDPSVERLDPEDIALHTIPVLPIGFGAAREILARMTGDPAPPEWVGGLDLDYRITGGPDLTVRVRVNQPKALTRATNVVGMIRGSEFPDEWFILGAHYDPWGFGAIDPNGGTAMLLTLADALGRLSAEGCASRRSILIAHWDAEEYGIIGSTEWVEEFRTELEAKAIAYVNADAAVSGPNVGGSSSPSLKAPIFEALRAVEYPGTDGSIFEWWAERSETTDEPPLGNLGGGSDHVGFYTHAGVPSAGLSTGGPGGVYHSNYDNFAWFERFGDTAFVYGPMLARADGILALRFANADVLPYDVVRYAVDTRTHVETLYTVAEQRRLSVDLTALVQATDGLESAARAFEAARAGFVAAQAPEAVLTRVNAGLIGLEKAWLDDRGLQDRKWSRSLYVSPDPFSGYASWMLPGLRYEIETDDPESVPEWEARYIRAVESLTERIQAVTSLMAS